MPSTDKIDTACQQRLLSVARESIRQGLAQGRRTPVVANKAIDDREALKTPAACFVTLTLDDQLRGCIGTLEPQEPLLEAVAYFAYSAAFEDPRFPPLCDEEQANLIVEISVLSPMEPLIAHSEPELLAALRPHIDGIWLDAGAHRATFLPQVWEQLPEPHQFIQQLRRKAGLAADGWDDSIYWYRYTVISFSA